MRVTTLTDTPEFERIWEQVSSHTDTSRSHGKAIYDAVHLIAEQEMSGSIVLCGVQSGGLPLLVVSALEKLGTFRKVFLFDSFTEANSEAKLKALLDGTDYDKRGVQIIAGDLAETASQTSTLNISLLCIDPTPGIETDVALASFYPRTLQGGVFLIGPNMNQTNRKAVDDYFAESDYKTPVIWPVEPTSFGGVKAEARVEAEIDRYDYIPPGMTSPDILNLFSHAEIQDPWSVGWEYLRCEVPHIWRSDTRDTTGYRTGNASVEEATCLFELGRQFAGKRGLEVGSHFGWTGSHLLATGMEMDFIDPEFGDPARKAAVLEVFDAVAEGRTYRTWAGYSPDILGEVRRKGKGRLAGLKEDKWSFAFIDGNHDGDAPKNDAKGVIPHLAADAVVVFHDLTSPHVEQGLNTMRNAGFKTCLFNTMQILGVAWRGNVEIPVHIPDENVLPVFQAHLNKYSISPNNRD